MKTLRHLRHPIETVRTAPLGTAFVAVGIGMAALTEGMIAPLEPEKESTAEFVLTELVDAGIASYVGGPAFLKGMRKIHYQLQARERLEYTIERSGYDERVMERTLLTWCGRQMAIVACERVGGPEMADQYKGLIEANKHIIQLPNLRHI